LFTSRGGSADSDSTESALNQGCAELAHALYLTIPVEELRHDPTPSHVLQGLLDKLSEAGQMFGMMRLGDGEQKTKEERAVRMLQEHLRMHTQVVRNWGYHDAVKRTLRELYRDVSDDYKKVVGFTPQDIVMFFSYLVDEMERRVNDHRRRLLPAMREKSTQNVIRRFYRDNPHLQDSVDDMLATARRNGFSREEVATLLWAYQDHILPDCFRFRTGEVSEAAGLGAEETKKIVESMSMRLGELSKHDRLHFFLGNPVWERPLIAVPDDEFFCPNPQSFFHFSKTIIDGLAKHDPKLKAKIERARAEYLELEVVRLVQEHFPSHPVKQGFEWKSDDVAYETDLVVLVDSHLIIIEAKAGRVSQPALRGATERARKHVGDLLIEPSIQSSRLVEKIQEALRDPSARDELEQALQMDIRNVFTVLRLSVTLDDFATLQTNLELLKDAGWLPSDHRIAPCILVTDFDAVLEMLEDEAQKLHYIRRRSELAETVTTTGDELDHLGLYLKTSLVIAEAEETPPHLHLIGMSKDIDLYQEAKIQGHQREKPRMRLSPWWRQLLRVVQSRCFPRWTDVCMTLLDVPPSDQKKAEMMMARVRQNVKRLARMPVPPNDLQDSLFVLAGPRRRTALIFHAFHPSNAHKRHANMESLAAQAFDDAQHVDRCLVIASDVAATSSPYSTLGMFYRSEMQRDQVDDLVAF
jgi:hypothetical protein